MQNLICSIGFLLELYEILEIISNINNTNDSLLGYIFVLKILYFRKLPHHFVTMYLSSHS